MGNSKRMPICPDDSSTCPRISCRWNLAVERLARKLGESNGERASRVSPLLVIQGLDESADADRGVFDVPEVESLVDALVSVCQDGQPCCVLDIDEPMTETDIAEAMGLTDRSVRLIQVNAYRRLKKQQALEPTFIDGLLGLLGEDV